MPQRSEVTPIEGKATIRLSVDNTQSLLVEGRPAAPIKFLHIIFSNLYNIRPSVGRRKWGIGLIGLLWTTKQKTIAGYVVQ